MIDLKCKICENKFLSKNALAGHIGAKHRISVENYYIIYYLDNKSPKCFMCDKRPRFNKGKYTFQNFCTEHANEARRKWSKENVNMDFGWRKGLTKENNLSIAKHSVSVSGSKNPFFGKHHTAETISKISENNKQEIVKSMIISRLGISNNKIFARKCIVKEVDSKESKEFFERTHIAGNAASKITFGLYYDNRLVSAISLRRPIMSKKYENTIEMARFSSELGANIVGGFSKLLTTIIKWSKDNKYENILTYADMRFGTGNTYSKTGFELVGESVIDYWYTNGKERFNRFKFRAQKHNNLTEQQVASQNEVFKIYGCGSKLFVLKI